MTLPPCPSPLSEEELQVIAEKFDANEISKEQKERQEKYRRKLRYI